MPTVNYLRVIDCEHDAANKNESYRKDHRNSKSNLTLSEKKILSKTKKGDSANALLEL